MCENFFGINFWAITGHEAIKLFTCKKYELEMQVKVINMLEHFLWYCKETCWFIWVLF